MERASSVALAAASRRSAVPSASTAAIDTRKRKRGALQDISNRSKKLEALPTAASSARNVVKKEPLRPSTSSRSKRAAGNAAPVAGDALPKKRRAEGEHGGHQKVQSLLSFQPTASRGSRSRAHVTTRSGDKQEPAVVKRESVRIELKKRYTSSQSQSDDKENVVMEDEPMPETSDAEEQFTWAPRPYKFKFDHTGSGFTEQRYAASVRDIDAPNARKPGQCPKIVREIDVYHRQHETKYFPTPDYIGTLQTDINEKMRTILIDWLVEVGEEYELDSQTFHKAVNLVDRCLRKFKINRKQFQLLGCACMMVAAKFEEVYGPNVEEFVYISDQTYTAEEMLQMEAKVLQALEYRVASTTCYGFVQRYALAGCASEKQKSLVMYLCDYAQLYYRMLKFRPSMVVAAAVYLARVMTGEREAWTPTLHHVTKYSAWDLRPCVLELLRLHRVEADVVAAQREKAKAVSEKYFSDKFHAASAIPAVEEEVVEQTFLAFERPNGGSSSSTASSSSSSSREQ